MKIKLMIKRKALIKGGGDEDDGDYQDQEQSHHTREYIKQYKEITPWTIFLVISKRG
jgi:hypothetical protein